MVVVAALQPAPVPDRHHTLDVRGRAAGLYIEGERRAYDEEVSAGCNQEEELALRLAAERTRWELERERELSAEKDKVRQGWARRRR